MDWLSEDAAPPQALRITGEESALEIVWTHVNTGGLYPAAKVLAAAGGSIGPVLTGGDEPRSGRQNGQRKWMVRIPTYAGRNSYLLLMQGNLRLALPWHAALRLYMIPASKLESSLRALDLPLLDPLAPSARLAGDSPVVLVAHGLKRAYLSADRLVWRLQAEPCDTVQDPPAPVLSRAVRTEEGEIYWVAEPERLLAGVEFIVPVGFESQPKPKPKPKPAEPEPPILGRENVQPLRAAAAAPAVLPLVAPATRPALHSQTTEAPVPPAAEPSAPAAAAPVPRRALVIDDSIAARIFLARLLEQMGFAVLAVADATELFRVLDASDWSLICVDVELPEARGVELLKAVAGSARVHAAGTPVVALVRDDADVNAANAAGITRSLRKPFERRAVEGLLEKLGLPTAAGGSHA
jgi:CheY-like chemotaxis protein